MLKIYYYETYEVLILFYYFFSEPFQLTEVSLISMIYLKIMA